MRKLFLIVMLGVIFAFPSSFAFAQTNITLPSMSVQLWPEYDQPSMLVLTDFELPADTALPVNLTFRIPKDANLIAVANYTSDGKLADAVFDGPKADGDWQVFTITMNSTAARFEYYDAITFSGNKRIYSYLWDGTYAVDQFNIRVLQPLDTTSLTTDPSLPSIANENDLKYFVGDPVKLAAGEMFPLNLQYEKTTDSLVSASQGIQAPVDENTQGRISLNNSLPYVIGGLGVIMLVGGSIYLWQSNRKSSKKPRRRASAQAEAELEDGDTYCPQCGARAKAGDRFCRTCGARLRHQEE
ncbi:MAG: zinc ribbon domain-containing protein [Anaerolineales bacterium]